MESKRNKTKVNKFPESALAFYIKLYCKQKRSSETKYHSNLVEATKSWLSLTEEEKQEVLESYKEKKHKFKLQCFDQLKNAETFMRIKVATGSKNVDLNSSSSVIQEPEDHIKKVRLQTETGQLKPIVNDEDMNLSYDGELVTDIAQRARELDLFADDRKTIMLEYLPFCEKMECGPEHDLEHYENIREPIQHTNEETPRTFLVEPLPPTLKTSKDLFYMLNPAGGAETVSWTSLQTSEKNQYRRAVSLLKTDYITKYKEYLESLTPKDLYDYYNKTLL